MFPSRKIRMINLQVRPHLVNGFFKDDVTAVLIEANADEAKPKREDVAVSPSSPSKSSPSFLAFDTDKGIQIKNANI